MNRPRALYHLVRADFLERVRRYSFLLTIGFAVYLSYAVYSRQITLQLNMYRGIDNSAWLGAVMGLIASVWVSLIGFYIVKNSIERDRQTRVGQILAATPMNRSFYTLGKALSNFAVLSVMLLILAFAAVIIQLLRGESEQFQLFQLLGPILIFGLSAVAVVAALSVLFESLPVLRSGIGNVLYFFLWTALVSISVTITTGNRKPTGLNALRDFTGIAAVMGQMQAAVYKIDPNYGGGSSFGLGGLTPTTKTFLFTGVHWNSGLILGRVLWLGVAVMLALLAALFFDRFDPSRRGWSIQKRQKPSRRSKKDEMAFIQSPVPNGLVPVQNQMTAAQLTPLTKSGSEIGSRNRFFALMIAEFRLQFRGQAWWWYLGAAGLFIACLASPLDSARSGVILAAWLWPMLIWSQMGTREERNSTNALIFSAPHAIPRQLFASYAAGVLITALTGGGLGLHLLIARDFEGLAAWAAAAVFIPALALFLGVTSGTRKTFEAIYTAWWYIGPLHHIPQIDFMGTSPNASMPIEYSLAAVLLVSVAYSWRKLRLAGA